jgi:hypothetical protein
MSIIYKGIGIVPEDVYVVVIQPEACPSDDERLLLAYERYGELIKYGSPLGERVVGVRTAEEAKDFILRLLKQHIERGEKDEAQGNDANASVSG